jgi:probable rRNA maturation factor
MTIPIIQFNFLVGVGLTDRTRLKQFLARLVKKEGKKLAELQYIFCSDDYLLAINQEYLGHDDYTDIITFDLSAKPQPINAEIYISVPRVRENARIYKTTVGRELHRVIFHGALHLCGYKDKTPKDQKMMREMEEKCLLLYKRSTWKH